MTSVRVWLCVWTLRRSSALLINTAREEFEDRSRPSEQLITLERAAQCKVVAKSSEKLNVCSKNAPTCSAVNSSTHVERNLFIFIYNYKRVLAESVFLAGSWELPPIPRPSIESSDKDGYFLPAFMRNISLYCFTLAVERTGASAREWARHEEPKEPREETCAATNTRKGREQERVRAAKQQRAQSVWM